MISAHSQNVAERAKALYIGNLKSNLESKHLNAYVAIEPESGEYFLGETFSSALRSARTAYPERIAFVIHIGHAAAIHLGVLTT